MSRARRPPHPDRVRHIICLGWLFFSAPAAAQDFVAHQRLVGVIEPVGAEHMLALGVRAPLGDPDELLFTGAHAEAGLVSYTSPIYTRNGGYLQLSPLAFLVLRAELRHAQMWSIGMPGAGYFPVGQDEPEGGEASGWEAHVSAIVQGLVPLGDTRLLLWNQLAFEGITLGPAEAYFSPRHDATLTRRDAVLANTAMLMWELDLAADLHLRLGAYSDLAWIASSERLAHQVGPVAMLLFDAPDPHVSAVLPFIRGGVYTDGPRSGGFTMLLGLMVDYR